MALKKMKKTPTGGGSGYTNVDSISCKKISGTKVKCSLKPKNGKTEELTGAHVNFMNIAVYMYPQTVVGVDMKNGNLLACFVDSGVITCLPEKELKK